MASLYERLGRRPGIAAVVAAFYRRAFADPSLAVFFRGHSVDSRARIVRQTVEYFCAIAGGPERYTGRDMKTAHAGLGAGETEWRNTGAHLKAALAEAGAERREADELLALVARDKDRILERP